ncbi:efflux RND transporter periplasmic adaptor subunit [Pedobacter sp. MC2016-24]|uniref:efflux RND transporter periplasmic adaptor subunit n=1 Tax=Pedobacter sp. MC2016-24 TaxID=2780090 RepID=UPI001D160EF9|nr:efflux RND transporter periplasmic adaptor subunit [Pedobacter sp. MC2016-24]
MVSCGQQTDTVTDTVAEVISPVEVTTISRTALAEYTELSAVSSYQQKSYVKANINGYIQSAKAVVGNRVTAGSLLFSLITKEARAIGNAVNQLDPGLRFSGVSTIRADQSGFITSVSHQKGDYVQDGEALAVISNQNSLVFLLDLPYELHRLLSNQQAVEVLLPDGERLEGQISGSLPVVDSLAQTQRMIIKVSTPQQIPEGLIGKVKIRKASSPNAQVLPKSAVLSNETEDEFWVMKMTNDSTAVKVPVKKGIENDKLIEIVSPIFKSNERIISTGNYGIADTAKVKVVKQL